MSHTPGPWEATAPSAANGWWIVSAAHGEVGSGDGGYEEADARLIAAAPDMLAALQVVECHFDAVGNQTKMAADVVRAIMKATGAQ